MQEAVERACDELDYEGSWIYDEYPDRGRMEREQLKIQKRLLLRQEERNPLSQESGKGQGGLPQKNGQRGILQEDEVSVETAAREKRGIGELLQVLWYNEVFRRRCRRRKCRRHY